MSVVSIIVPVYNASKYLHEAIDSVFAQTYEDWQLILVDDGSTDSSAKICDHYAATDSRIVVVHIQNGGQSYARNRGLDLVRSEWVTFLDADDRLHPVFLSLLLNVARESGSEIVATAHTESVFRLADKYKVTSFTPEQAIEATLYQRSKLTCSPCGKIFKKSFFDDVKFSEGLYYEDLDCFYRLFEQSNSVTFVDAQLYFYRQHSESFIHKWDTRRLDVLKVVDELERYIAEHHSTLLPAARDRKLSANFNMFNLSARHNEVEFANRCWSVIKQYRFKDFLNPKIRLKNRLGIIASYLGRRIYTFIAKKCLV